MAGKAGPSGLPKLPVGHGWYTESVERSLFHSLVLKRTLFSGTTRLQRVEIIDTDPFGKTLVLDDKTQSAAADEFIYHEALVHPAMIAHDSPRNVFIAGGGEGATLREVLAHGTVERVVIADVDGELVDLCREHMPEGHQGAFEDPRVELMICDAREELECHGADFDVIVVDVTDPTEVSLALPLFTEDFYRMALKRLKPGGIFVTQAGPAGLGMTPALSAIHHTVLSAFKSSSTYATEVRSFGSAWGFVMAGDHLNLTLSIDEIDRRIVARMTRPVRFYDGETHQGIFSLPKWLRERLAEERHTIRVDDPVFIE